MYSSPRSISPEPFRSRRRVTAAGLALGALLAGGLLAGCSEKSPSFKSTDITGADYGKALTLTNASTGKQVSLEDFHGKVVMLFFGFTHCPDVCPTTLLKAAEVRKQLGDDADRMQVLFVTVDPERDSAEVLSKYVPAFHPSFIGLRGDQAEINKAAREFKVFFQKVPNRDGSSYNVEHTAASYILDPEGRLRLFVRHTQPVEEIVSDLRQLL